MANILTDDNIELLRIIYSYGGYTRVKHIEQIYNGLCNSSLYRKLDKLENLKYLTSRRLKSNSKIEQKTYQVTYPTCRLFNNPQSHFRKKHQEEYIYRALIKNFFYTSIHNEFKNEILADNESRIMKLEEGNFDKNLFPRKYNSNTSFIHFEEMMIDFTTNNGKELRYNGDMIYNDEQSQVIVTYIDEYYKEPKNQVIKLINKYIGMINQGGNFQINFLIIVDDNNRKNIYEKYIDTFMKAHGYTEKISENLLNIYKDLLIKLNQDDELKQQIMSNYKNGKLKDIIISNIVKEINILSDIQKNIVRNVKMKGENYIFEYVKETVSQNNLELSKVKLEEFFNDLFSLEYNKFISFGTDIKRKFDIKVIQIVEKIYQ